MSGASAADIIAEMERKLLGMPEKERSKVVKEALDATASWLWVPNPGVQTEAYYCDVDELLYGGEAGGGKGLLLSEPVLTPFGWKAIGDLGLGSTICAPDGTATKIIGYFRRGVQPTYRIRFHDGSDIVCDADHIWLAWMARGSRKIGNVLTSGEGGARKWTTRDIAAHYAKGLPRIGIPAVKSVCFNVAGVLKGPGKFVGRPIPPYVLGVLLGDGYVGKRGTAKFTTDDQAIVDRVSLELGCGLYEYKSENRCTDYRIPTAAIGEGMADLDLWGKLAGTKSIPRQYLFAPEDDRWALLQGLMDTDGWAEEDGAFFCTVSPFLARDVCHLARSLGAVVTTRGKNPFYVKDGERVPGQHAYTLWVKMPDPSRCFSLERKKAVCADYDPQSMARWIESIEAVGEEETVCIAVDHPSSLFIVHDFIVTHNTDILIGKALGRHRKSLILRRVAAEVPFVIERMEEIIGHRKGFNGQHKRWHIDTPGGAKLVAFGGCQHPGDERDFKGDRKDFIGIDEGSEFLESQVDYLVGWLGSTVADQPCQLCVATNPPMLAEGMWIIKWWAPWIDENHARYPTPYGQPLWCVRNADDSFVWLDSPEPVEMDGRIVKPKSRTFIRGGLKDNPDLARTGYGDQLNSMRSDLRKVYAEGNFMAGMGDQERQVIPTAWIKAAQDRWKPDGWRGEIMDAMALDPAGGGRDSAELARRYGGWFAELISKQDIDTREGDIMSALVLTNRRNGAEIVIDVGGGYAGAVIEHFKANNIVYHRFDGGAGSSARSREKLRFANKRSWAWWTLGEALDPEQEGGSVIALPPDAELRGDLASATFKIGVRGIQVESKDDIRKRLGRSPGKGDAVVMCHSEGNRALARRASRIGIDLAEQSLVGQPGNGPRSGGLKVTMGRGSPGKRR